MVNEIARFHRLSSVRTAGSLFHDADDAPEASCARPVTPSRPSPTTTACTLPDCWRESRSGCERDDVSAQVLQGDVPRSREAEFGAQVAYLQASVGEDRFEASVLVLIDDEDANAWVRLAFDRVEQASELLHPSHRRDDEVERRKLPRHGP